MSPLQQNFWLIIFSFSALHGFFIFFILMFAKKENKRENFALALLVLAISLILSNHALYLIGFFEKAPHLIYGSLPIWFIVGPLFYNYFHSLLSKPSGFKWIKLLHFLPLTICLIIMYPFYSLPSIEKLNLLHGIGEINISKFKFTVILYLYTFQTVTYIIFSWNKVKKYESNYKNESANTKVISIEWLRSLILILIIFLAIDFVIGSTMSLLEIQNQNYSNASIVTVSLFIYFIAYNLILHPNRVFSKSASTTSNNTDIHKYKKSNLELEEINTIEQQLDKVMYFNKPYLNEDLKLPDLAKLIEVSPHKLSQVLNQSFNQNFYNYINQHRVKEVQKKLVEEVFKNQTIQTIALQSGFNSNASFYRVFKQQTGLTPTQYIKTQHIST